MTTNKPFQLGSVSTGTLKTEDLLPKLSDTLDRLQGMDSELTLTARSSLNPEDSYEMWQLLNEELNVFCPPFVYFGAHPDDPADFGFWVDWDALHDAVELEGYWDTVFNPHNDKMLDHSNSVFIQALSKYQVTVMDLDGNVLWSTI